ncbi:hypothetical protein CDAR_97231 [Caerostris darwini]|uniref:Uncharacterized protein n=1 Tax=Caerostris darwini TaxID=1538125 RepID=A0AAV4QP47_9ARAC|nr:hypothetical protein CDAR_97231 [Caerostris darwini]
MAVLTRSLERRDRRLIYCQRGRVCRKVTIDDGGYREQKVTFSRQTSTMGDARQLHGRILIPHRKKDRNIRSSIYGCLDTITEAT